MIGARIARRKLLAVAGVAPAAWLLPELRVRTARAVTPPRRLLLVFTPNGVTPGHWPTGDGADYQLGPRRTALQPWRDRLLFLRGVHLLSGRDGPGNGHTKGAGCLFTGAPLLKDASGDPMNAGYPIGPSVDQVIAARIGGATHFPSLSFGVMAGPRANVLSRISYAAAARPVPPVDDPGAAFRRVFAGLGAEPEQMARLARERRSVLDYVARRAAALRGIVGADARRKLDAHAEAVRSIERRLVATAASTCRAPAAPPAFPELYQSANYPAVGRLQMDMAAAALACDLTRVAVLQWSRASGMVIHNWQGITGETHHDLSHYGDSDEVAQGKLAAIDEWYGGELAYLLGRLASFQEDGGTLLDHTLVVWVNELSAGNTHSLDDLPFILTGGGVFRTGRYLRYAGDGHAHNKLLVSLCHAMGLADVTSFGATTHGAGPLPDLS